MEQHYLEIVVVLRHLAGGARAPQEFLALQRNLSPALRFTQ